MIIKCKRCGKDETENFNKVSINEIILSGRIYIDSSGNEVGLQKISWCKCNNYENTKKRHKN